MHAYLLEDLSPRLHSTPTEQMVAVEVLLLFAGNVLHANTNADPVVQPIATQQFRAIGLRMCADYAGLLAG